MVRLRSEASTDNRMACKSIQPTVNLEQRWVGCQSVVIKRKITVTMDPNDLYILRSGKGKREYKIEKMDGCKLLASPRDWTMDMLSPMMETDIQSSS